MNIKQIIMSEIDKLSVEDLSEINQYCCQVMKDKRRRASMIAKSSFSSGDTVAFGEIGARGKMSRKIGTIKKIKRTRAEVRVVANGNTVKVYLLIRDMEEDKTQ